MHVIRVEHHPQISDHLETVQPEADTYHTLQRLIRLAQASGGQLNIYIIQP